MWYEVLGHMYVYEALVFLGPRHTAHARGFRPTIRWNGAERLRGKCLPRRDRSRLQPPIEAPTPSRSRGLVVLRTVGLPPAPTRGG